METNQEVILEMKDIMKIFPGVIACNKARITVRKGTVHALVGENGAGKSTLMKVLAGEHTPDGGEIYFQGRKVEIHDTREALGLGISTVYQELNLVPEMSIAENIFLGREPVDKSKLLVNFKDIFSESAHYLNELGLDYDPKTKVKHLSVSAAQMIEIAKGISRGASLIVLDEPTSAITDTEVEILFQQINRLKEKGISFVYISHKMDELFVIADDVTVMRDGEFVGTHAMKDIDEQHLIALMVGRELTELFPKVECQIGEVVFEAKNLWRKKTFEGINFSVRKGEILGISGLMGAGRTELARAIFGLDALDGGEMLIDGQPVTIQSPTDAIKHGIIMLPEDRKLIGLVLGRSILDNIALPNLEQFENKGLLNIKAMFDACNAIAQQIGVKTPSIKVEAKTLSGGNQQKVVICKWLLQLGIKVLILDEPTRGIDVGAKSEIHKLMGEFARQGMAIIMISSELPEIIGMSDRIIVMREGKFVGELSREETTQEKIMTFATGGKQQ